MSEGLSMAQSTLLAHVRIAIPAEALQACTHAPQVHWQYKGCWGCVGRQQIGLT